MRNREALERIEALREHIQAHGRGVCSLRASQAALVRPIGKEEKMPLLWGKKKVKTVSLKGPGSYPLPVVGESYYQEALRDICGNRKEEGERKKVQALLIPEDNNPHDSQAVRVEIQGKTVGHLSKEHARQFRKGMAEAGFPGAIGICNALIKGGWMRKDSIGHYGVSLDVFMEDDGK